MKTPMSIVFFLTGLSLSSASPVEKVYMPFFELINVHEDYQYSLARLFKGYVEEVGRFELVTPERPDTVIRQPGKDSSQMLALQAECEYFLLGDLNRVGETVMISLSLYTTKEGRRIWGDRLQATTPEDMDPVFRKLARALGSGEKAAVDGDIYSVTGHESRELRQIQVMHSFGISIGGALFTSGMISGDSWEDPFVGGFGLLWTYDARNLLFEVDGEMYPSGGTSRLGSISISAMKPFKSERLTPFAGGGLGIGMAGTDYQGEDTEGNGLLVHGGGGIIFNRTSTVQLRFQARYVIGLFTLEAPRDDFPHAILLRMELTFGR